MNDLDKSINDHYLDKRMSDVTMDRIIAMGEAAKQSKSHQDNDALKQRSISSQFGWLRANNWQVASIVLFMAIMVGVFIGQSNQFSGSVTELVLEEIAMNHNKGLAVEYPIKEYGSLRIAMSRLDFVLSHPQKLSDNYQLLGGRYCSIQGRIAAQLKVKDIRDGKIATLYVTPLTNRLSNISSQETLQDNVSIMLWVEDNLLYGLATNK